MNKTKKKEIVKITGIVSFIILVILILFFITLFLVSHSKLGIDEKDNYFMEIAYNEAESAIESGNVPVGAVLVINDTIISKAHNQYHPHNNSGGHAEILAIKKALNKLDKGNFGYVSGKITLYTTYEPCPMCEGFIIWKKVPKVIVGKRKNFIKLMKENYFPHIYYRFNERSGINQKKT